MSVETISKPLRSNAPGAEIIFRGLRYTSASDAKCRAEDCGTRSIHVHPLIAFTPKPRSGGARRRCGARGEGDLSFRGSSEKKKQRKRTETEKEEGEFRIESIVAWRWGEGAPRREKYITMERNDEGNYGIGCTKRNGKRERQMKRNDCIPLSEIVS